MQLGIFLSASFKDSLCAYKAEYMIICSCNIISDKDVLAAIASGASRPSQIYAHKQCRADCGGCTKKICQMLKETKKAASKDCANTCPNHSHCQAKRLSQAALSQETQSYVLSA